MRTTPYENKALHPVHDNVLQPPSATHFLAIRRLGFPDGVRCLNCGEQITFTPREKATVQKQRRAFCQQHLHCESPESLTPAEPLSSHIYSKSALEKQQSRKPVKRAEKRRERSESCAN